MCGLWGFIGLAHRVTQDDVYKGLFIAKGTIVYPNIWAMLYDPQTYPSPSSFDPGRFLETDLDGRLKLRKLEKAEDPGWVAFGFGRRYALSLESFLTLDLQSLNIRMLYSWQDMPGNAPR